MRGFSPWKLVIAVGVLNANRSRSTDAGGAGVLFQGKTHGKSKITVKSLLRNNRKHVKENGVVSSA